jgi:hypothetical protein
MSGTLRQFSVTLFAWAAIALLSGCPVDPQNPAGVVLERDTGNFTPSQEFTVTVTIRANNASSISALGLTETVPEGWTFVAADGETGQVPVMKPAEGATGSLEFLWWEVPSFPVTFTYTLLVPADAPAAIDIAGRVDYYQSLGLLSSDETVSSISSAPS